MKCGDTRTTLVPERLTTTFSNCAKNSNAILHGQCTFARYRAPATSSYRAPLSDGLERHARQVGICCLGVMLNAYDETFIFEFFARNLFSRKEITKVKVALFLAVIFFLSSIPTGPGYLTPWNLMTPQRCF